MKLSPRIIFLISIPADLVILFFVWVFLSTYQPADVQPEEVICSGSEQPVPAGKHVKILSWNVQYMAGKNYVFFYDILDGSGPDTKPLRKDIEATFSEVARIINDENPDIILLQEIDQGAARTEHEDQIARLQSMISGDYSCSVSSYYWKADFVPHPKVMGSAGMKLLTLSKFKIDAATRYQLALIPDNFLVQQFNIKRAVLESIIPAADGRRISVMNTHLDAFAQGSDTMQQQVDFLKGHLGNLTDAGTPWLLGGDLNLLPGKKQYDLLEPEIQAYYNPESELIPLLNLYRSNPPVAETLGLNREKWFTHYPNGYGKSGPDRTIDYILFSREWEISENRVRIEDAKHISDHMPVISVISLK